MTLPGSTCQLLDSQLTHPWTLGELADRLHLSPGYLLRLFKSSTGMPPMAYPARRRVETAAGLLLHTDQSVTQIGRSVGWPDQNSFARRFKAHFGLSATTYRSRFADRTRRLQTWLERRSKQSAVGQFCPTRDSYRANRRLEQAAAMTPAGRSLPRGFVWGTATAAHQIEGGNWNNDWWAR